MSGLKGVHGLKHNYIRNTRREEMEIPPHFIHDIKTEGYDVIGVNVFLRKLMRSPGTFSANYSTYIYNAVKPPYATTSCKRPSIKNTKNFPVEAL